MPTSTGMRPANHKGMVRETSLELRDDAYVRVIKQVSRSNTHASGTISKLQEANIPLAKRQGELTCNCSARNFASVSRGAVEVVRLLDRLQKGAKGHGLKKRSLSMLSRMTNLKRHQKREQAVEQHVAELAAYERDLDVLYDAGQLSQAEQMKKYVEAVREHVHMICVEFPSYTKDALGEAVIEDYQTAHDLFESGGRSGGCGVASGASGRESAIVIWWTPTELLAQDPNNPQNNDQSLDAILERLLQRDWKKRVDACRLCGNKNVMAEKR